MVYGEQDIIVSFIGSVIVVKMIKIIIMEWLIHVFRVQGLVLTESLLFLNQKTLM
jgi:hypothetical protein